MTVDALEIDPAVVKVGRGGGVGVFYFRLHIPMNDKNGPSYHAFRAARGFPKAPMYAFDVWACYSF